MNYIFLTLKFKEWTDPSHFFSHIANIYFPWTKSRFFYNHKSICSRLAHRDISWKKFKLRQVCYSVLLWEFWSTMKTHFGLSKADVGSQNSYIKSVTFAWHGGETLGTFSSPFIKNIRFYGSCEAYLSNRVSHQYIFVVDVV